MRAFTDVDRQLMRDPLFSARYRAASAHDGSFDGWFVIGTPMSGNFCRPGCSIRAPRPSRVRFYRHAAAAYEAGLLPCPRCRPDRLTPLLAPAEGQSLVGAAIRLIDDGAVARSGVGGVAATLGITERHLSRILRQAVGSSPLALARTGRVHLARLLLIATALPVGAIATAVGFGTLRQFDETFRQFYGLTPSAVRGAAQLGSAAQLRSGEPVILRYSPLPEPRAELPRTLALLARSAVPEVESAGPGSYTRVLRLPHGAGQLRVDLPERGAVVRLAVEDPRDLRPATARTHRILGLAVRSAPYPPMSSRPAGSRPTGSALFANAPAGAPPDPSPGAPDLDEAVIRAVVSAHCPPRAAREVLGRLAAAVGDATGWGLQFPTAAQLRGRVRHYLPDHLDLAADLTAVGEVLGSRGTIGMTRTQIYDVILRPLGASALPIAARAADAIVGSAGGPGGAARPGDRSSRTTVR